MVPMLSSFTLMLSVTTSSEVSEPVGIGEIIFQTASASRSRKTAPWRRCPTWDSWI